MKILIVVEYFPCLSETFVLNQVTGLIELGHDVQVYPVGKLNNDLIHNDFKKYNLQNITWQTIDIPQAKYKRIIQTLLLFPKTIKVFGLKSFQLLNFLRYGKHSLNLGLFYSSIPFLNIDWKPDFILCHFGDRGLNASIWQKTGVIIAPFATIIHAHEIAGLSDKEGILKYKPLIDSKSLILPISHYWEEKLVKWGASKNRIKVHRMGVDLKRFNFQKHLIPDNITVRILSIGRLVEQKGFEYAIKAMHLLKEKNIFLFKHIIIGGGELENKLQNLVNQLNLNNIVEFRGPQDQDFIAEELTKAHIFLLPSVTASNGFMEGIPVALMESMAVGLPVVSTNHSGIPELVTHNLTGLLVNEKDEVGLANEIERLVHDKILYEEIAKNGRQKIEDEFNISALNQQLVKLFEEELNIQKS